MTLGTRVIRTVAVACAECGAHMQGHPSGSFHAVGRHINELTGMSCEGFTRYANPLKCEHVTPSGEPFDHDCVGAK